MEVIDMLPVLIVVTVSWVYTFVNLSKLVKCLNICNLVCQNYTSMKLFKKMDRGEEGGNPFKNTCIQCYCKSSV